MNTLPALIEVLSIGKGDMKLTLSGDTPEDRAKAAKTIADMLEAGYGIFVETARGLRRVKRFNPKRMTYIIGDVPDSTSTPAQRKRAERQVPVAGSRAKAVGATAGG